MSEFEIITLTMEVIAIIFALWVKPNRKKHKHH